jgi:hypothetical protein
MALETQSVSFRDIVSRRNAKKHLFKTAANAVRVGIGNDTRAAILAALELEPSDRTPEDNKVISMWCRKHFGYCFFDRFTPRRADEICSRLQFLQGHLGKAVMTQGTINDGEFGLFVYFVIKGGVELHIDDNGTMVTIDSRMQVDKMNFYGEAGVRDGTPRSATVISTGRTVYATLAAKDYQELCLCGEMSLLEAQINRETDTKTVQRRAAAMKECPWFATLPDTQRHQLSLLITDKSYTRGSVIAKQGDPLRVIIVKKGEVLVSSVAKSHRTRKYAFNPLEKTHCNRDQQNFPTAIVGAQELLLEADIFASRCVADQSERCCSETCKAFTNVETYELALARRDEDGLTEKFVNTILPSLIGTGPYTLKKQLRKEMRQSRSRVRRSLIEFRQERVPPKVSSGKAMFNARYQDTHTSTSSRSILSSSSSSEAPLQQNVPTSVRNKQGKLVEAWTIDGTTRCNNPMARLKTFAADSRERAKQSWNNELDFVAQRRAAIVKQGLMVG